MAFGKKNVVKIDPFSYNFGLLGEPGIGKTTIIREMCEAHLGDDGYLFVECGKEDGADAIQGINHINCPEWSMDYDEDTNSVGFEELIDDILDNKTTEYPNLKVVVIDTYDQLYEIAVPEVIRLSNLENPEKKVKSINAAFGGFGRGGEKCCEIILEKLWSLKSVGVHFMCIGHLKQREITDAITGESYMQVTTDMQLKAFNALKNKLHFLGVATIDREIVKEKKQAKAKAKANGEDTKGVVVGETRKITFRDDNYSIDSKSRFADIEGTIAFDPETLYSTLCNAIKAEVEKTGAKVSDLKKEQDKALAEREKKIAAMEELKKSQKEVDEIVDQIVVFCAANKSDKNKLATIIAKTKELGYANPKMITSLEDAQAVLALCE